MNISTVNVLEINEGIPQNIHSFPDNKEGNEEAKVLFRKMAEDNGISEEDIEVGLEDGSVEQGTWSVFLIHTNGGKEIVTSDVEKFAKPPSLPLTNASSDVPHDCPFCGGQRVWAVVGKSASCYFCGKTLNINVR